MIILISHKLDEIKKLENIAGVKFFLGKSTGDLIISEDKINEFLKVLKQKDILAAFHCEKKKKKKKYKKDEFKYLYRLSTWTYLIGLCGNQEK